MDNEWGAIMEHLLHDNSAFRSVSLRLLTLGIFLYCLLLHIFSQAAECLFAIQLTDPEVKAEYEAAIADTRNDEFAQNGILDPVAIHCLACHDGTLAIEARYRIS